MMVSQGPSGPATRTDVLLDRADELERLERLLAQVEAERSGAAVLVSGEAGVGKTALLKGFADGSAGRARILRAGCEPLLAARPIGPFDDLAQALGGELRELVGDHGKPHAIAMALLAELREPAPALLILDDLHWADEGTLDVVRLMVRRLAGEPLLIALSFRDDELGPWHPLRILVGELSVDAPMTRIRLAPLSQAAIGTLAEPFGVDPAEVYRRTGGNPFFATELLAAGGEEMPDGVADAVLARVARLPAAARAVVEAAAVAGPAAELWLIDRLRGDAGERLDEGVAAGVLISGGDTVSFRHELAREAVLSAVGDQRKMALHRATLDALSSPPWGEPDLARLAHHAIATGDRPLILRYAPEAAAHASCLGAHREAGLLYEHAADVSDAVPLEERAALFEHLANERLLIVDFDSGQAAMRRAAACYGELGDELREGAALTALADFVWEAGSLPDALEIATRAAAQLERSGAGKELVEAHCMVARLLLAAEDVDGARDRVHRAQRLEANLGGTDAGGLLAVTSGWIEFLDGDVAGLRTLEASVEAVHALGLHELAPAIHVVIVRTALRRRLQSIGERHVRLGLEQCEGRDVDLWRYYLISWQAKVELARCQWDKSTMLAEICMTKPCPFSRIHALVALGTVRARRGDPDPWTPLDEALESALPRRELQWIGPVAAARAEAAWLEGRRDAMAAELEPALGFEMRPGDPYAAALAFWGRRAGMEVAADPGPEPDPCMLEVAGDWAAAVERWRELGYPYEAAMARTASPDERDLRTTLDELHELGAQPAAAIVARMLRKRGVRSIPRGPRETTRSNPAGLTAREVDVVALLVEGLRNSEIAERLVVSQKTVDHHVSSILRKLDVGTRQEAAATAIGLGFAREA
jgi:DNA-binding CsgD family transcriptional regulator